MSTLSRPLTLARKLGDFIEQAQFPCVGAKSALSRQQITTFEAGSLLDDADDGRILRALYKFVASYRADPKLFSSFALIFEGPDTLTEKQFEAALWRRLGALNRLDARRYSWSEEVSSNPASPHFGFSVGSQAFFVVGLHPQASRTARRFAHPTIIFNAHDQFTALREDGRYERIRDRIIERDRELDGEANPMLAEHGTSSEARQYSGRQVEAGWRCPFDPV